jgi:hypothetical protein
VLTSTGAAWASYGRVARVRASPRPEEAPPPPHQRDLEGLPRPAPPLRRQALLGAMKRRWRYGVCCGNPGLSERGATTVLARGES